MTSSLSTQIVLPLVAGVGVTPSPLVIRGGGRNRKTASRPRNFGGWYRSWFDQVPEPLRFLVAGNLGNVVFYFVDFRGQKFAFVQNY